MPGSPMAPTRPTGMIEVVLGRISSTSSRRKVADLASVSVTRIDSGPSADDADGDPAVGAGNGVGQVVGLDHGAGALDLAINCRSIILYCDAGEVWADRFAAAVDLVAG